MDREDLRKILVWVERSARELRHELFGSTPSSPKRLLRSGITVLGEIQDPMADKIQYKAVLPDPSSVIDVVDQVVDLVNENTGASSSSVLSLNERVFKFEVEQDSFFKIRLSYRDDAKNEDGEFEPNISSGEWVRVFAKDTVAPAAPGLFISIEAIGETEGAPVVEPTTEAPVVEPTTEAPVVEPTTEAPVVEPTTEAPVVEPTTEAPVEPTTEAPVEPTTDAPVVE